jgi:CheY-like chemotaxis protein
MSQKGVRPKVLVVEDGEEYSVNLRRFLAQDFEFERAGDGEVALRMLSDSSWDLIFLDMRFDRAPRLVGDLVSIEERFSGDTLRARRFLEDNQGTYILVALREAGFPQPVVFSYDFDSEPRRFENLQRRYGPLSHLSDTAGLPEIRRTFLSAMAGAKPSRKPTP